MSSYIVKRKWIRKPTRHVELDKSNPLAKGMFCFDMFNGSGNAIYNAAKNDPYDDGVSNLGQEGFTRLIDGQEGKVIDSNSAWADGLHLHSTQPQKRVYTFLVMAKYDNNTADHTLASVDNDTASSWSVLLWADTNASQLRPAVNLASSLYGTNNSIPIDEWVTWGATIESQRNSGAGFNTDVDFYVKGKFDSSVVVGDFNPTQDNNIEYLKRTGGTAQTDGKISWIACWDRKLSAAEIKSFTENPYQLLKPRQYLLTTAVDGAITGSGAHTATTALSSGTAERAINSSGDHNAVVATSSGVAEHVITGIGSGQAITALSSGVGEHVITGSGIHQATTAASVGAGAGIITGSGAHNATVATSTGIGTSEGVTTGAGAHTAETATSTGVGIGGGVIIGSGIGQSETATSSGIAERGINGSGVHQATFATSTGVALRVITGSGAHQAETALSVGTEDERIPTESYLFNVSVTKSVSYNLEITKSLRKEVRV